MKVYQSAVTVSEGVLEYELNVDAKMDYLVWLHFAEIDSSVKKEGERVFDVLINEMNVSRVDIFKEVGGFAAFSLNYTVKNLSASVLSLKLVTVVGAPLISGIENYALVPNDPSTVPLQGMYVCSKFRDCWFHTFIHTILDTKYTQKNKKIKECALN